MNQLGFFINQQRCIGCHTCAVACKDWYNIEAGPENWMRILELERGKFPELSLAFLPAPCYHCEDPACLKVCPTRAISKRDKDGIVLVDSEKCIGKDECGALCIKACPWNCPQFNTHTNSKMHKCSMCFDRIDDNQQPICVEACPMFAIEVAPINEILQKHGENREAIGFKYSKKLNPSIVHKSK